MRKPVDDRDRGEVEHVARRRVEASHATLAENDVVIPFREDVLGAQKQLVYRRRHPTLEKHRLFHPTDGLEKRIVLHVAGADLDAVGQLRDHLRPVRVHRLRDDRESCLFARERQKLEAFPSHSLKGVRRAARLERTATQRVAAGGLHNSRRREYLRLRFNGARPADDDDSIAADRYPRGQSYDGALWLPLARHLLVGLGDVNDLRDTRQRLDSRRVYAPIVADESDRGTLRAWHRPRLVPHFLDDTDDTIDVFRRGVVLHDY